MQGIQTRLDLSSEAQSLLEELTQTLSLAIRQTYQRWRSMPLDPQDVLPWLQTTHGLTSHQAAAVLKRVEAYRTLDQETCQWQLAQAQLRLSHAEEKLSSLQAQIPANPARWLKEARFNDLRSQRFQARRKRDRLQHQVDQLQARLKHHDYSRVFGGRKLLGQRTRLDALDSPWKDEASWRREWIRKREQTLWMPGRGGESFGNQSMQWDQAILLDLGHWANLDFRP